MAKTALVAGVTGINGNAIARLLIERGWQVHGLSRSPARMDGVQPVPADLQDAAATAEALKNIDSDAVFVTTWLRRDTEAENIRVNGAMMRNLLAGRPKREGPRHVALVTGRIFEVKALQLNV